ncbi:MAG TPA: hypothetical protein GX695_01665 [Acholeplasmataceae bacterium]|nr:hypothetical protein [Acholeplasmataceae bacterium]
MKNKNLLNQLAYYGLLIVAIVFIVVALLNQLDLNNSFINSVLKIASNVATLFMVLVVSFIGWEYAKKQPTIWKVIFLIAAILAVAFSAMAIVN